MRRWPDFGLFWIEEASLSCRRSGCQPTFTGNRRGRFRADSVSEIVEIAGFRRHLPEFFDDRKEVTQRSDRRKTSRAGLASPGCGQQEGRFNGRERHAAGDETVGKSTITAPSSIGCVRQTTVGLEDGGGLFVAGLHFFRRRAARSSSLSRTL